MHLTAEQLSRLYGTIFGQVNEDDLARMERFIRRKGLDRRRRFLCAISALTVTDRPRQLRFMLMWAIGEGVGPEEIYEVILQSYLFAGYPAAIEGLFAFRDVLHKEGIRLATGENEYRVDKWRERGLELCRSVYGSNFDRLQQNMKALSPELADWMILEGYGKVLGRNRLGPAERELCTVAALTVLGRERQLLSHIKGALNIGARKSELHEAILQTSLFSSLFFTLRGLRLLRQC